MSASTTPRIAITMGDPAGIGPEILIKAVEILRPQLAAGKIKLFVVGSRFCMRRAAGIVNCGTDWIESGLPGVELVNIGDPADELFFGKTTAEAGKLAYLSIEKSVALCLAGEADAIVTAPISKEALNLAGHPFSGHTELLAHLTKARDSVMLLAHGDMRVSHVSTHVSLAEAVRRLTPERLTRVAELTNQAVRDLGIENPRIAVAALNPHAGEGGLFGTEDIDVTKPTVAKLKAGGMNIEGPIPGDTVFVKLRGRRYDAVIATYHDQGHIPVKLLGFEVNPETGAWEALSGVNITLGLPIVRSSVDHGTAFDIAGQGIASERSMLEAIEYAVQLAAARKTRGV